jgi:dTMP kinase
MDHGESEIEPFVASGGVVVSDRYDASSLAYQSASSEKEGRDTRESIAWIRALNSFARRPDLVIVLDLPADVAAERRAERGDPAELYEDDELQRTLAQFYRDLASHMPSDPVVVIDGTGTVEEVHARVWACAGRLFR